MKHFLGLICRCKDEYFIQEFVNYYLSQGVEVIHILDDNSMNKSIYRSFKEMDNVNVHFLNNIIEKDSVNQIFSNIKESFEWMIYVDVDEFIVTKRNEQRTIKEEIVHSFSDAHCIKIPWVLMISGTGNTEIL